MGLFIGNIPDEVEIDTPAGVKLNLKIHDKQLSSESATCAVQKDAGDDPDVTNGCFVHARLSAMPHKRYRNRWRQWRWAGNQARAADTRRASGH